MSVFEERKAADNPQWRRGLQPSTIGGRVWEGARLPPSEREEEQALLAAPSGARQENAATMNEYRAALAARPSRGCKRGQEVKRKLSRPP